MISEWDMSYNAMELIKQLIQDTSEECELFYSQSVHASEHQCCTGCVREETNAVPDTFRICECVLFRLRGAEKSSTATQTQTQTETKYIEESRCFIAATI